MTPGATFGATFAAGTCRYHTTQVSMAERQISPNHGHPLGCGGTCWDSQGCSYGSGGLGVAGSNPAVPTARNPCYGAGSDVPWNPSIYLMGPIWAQSGPVTVGTNEYQCVAIAVPEVISDVDGVGSSHLWLKYRGNGPQKVGGPPGLSTGHQPNAAAWAQMSL
jgi:hypothetical protein